MFVCLFVCVFVCVVSLHSSAGPLIPPPDCLHQTAPPPNCPSAEPPLRKTTPPPDRPNFRFFFPFPPHISFFLLSLGVSSWNCGRGSSRGHPKCASWAPVIVRNPSVFTRRPPETEPRTTSAAGEEKCEILGPPPFGPRLFLGLGPKPLASDLHLGSPTTTHTNLAKLDKAKMDCPVGPPQTGWPKMAKSGWAQKRIGPKRSQSLETPQQSARQKCTALLKKHAFQPRKVQKPTKVA